MTGTVLICLMLNQRLKQSPGLPNWPVTSTLFKQRGTILKHSLLPRQITAATTWCRQRARPIRPLLLVCPSMAGKAGQHMHEADSDSRRGRLNPKGGIYLSLRHNERCDHSLGHVRGACGPWLVQAFGDQEGQPTNVGAIDGSVVSVAGASIIASVALVI